jgi:alpha-L-rhamnosidase
MRIYDMKINHLTNPLGFRMTRTVFSWKVKEAVGKKQTKARIQIASDPTMKDILFDSGFDKEANSLAYKIDFPMNPCTRYYWQVTVHTDKEEEAISDVQWFETAKRNEQWVGKWITCDSMEKRHPFIEKNIKPTKAVKRARLYICGLGLYEAYFNGKKIGDEFLTPYSNDYNEWIQYQTFDITEHLQKEGTLSILLGNGWYKARFGFAAKEDKGFYGDEWKLIAEIQLIYQDGTKEVIGTDESWEVRRSKITFSNLYDGEFRDDMLKEMPIEKAVFCKEPKGKLTERMSLPVTIHEIFEPVELIYTPKGEKVFDMGQEFTGIFSLRVKEPAGTKIHIQTGEILQEGNFYNENLRSAKSEDIYIADGTEQIIIPHFTFYGYRYVKIQGVKNLKKEDFKGLALYSNLDRTGEITTGHPLVNRFIKNVRWGLKSNFVDLPTDCPQRDERMGWTGDAQVFSPTAMYLKDTYAFYAKYLYDMAKEQSVLDGKVPDVIPSCGVETTSCVWGDASCIIPWNMYLFYGDKSILEDQFLSMKSWVDYIRKIDGDNHGWRDVFHYGDWLALDNPIGGLEQVLGATDEEFIANLYYAISAGIVAKAAKVLGFEKEEKEYKKLSEEQFDVVKKEYYSSTGRCCIKTQTALLLTLKYQLSDNVELTKNQLQKLFDDNNGKLKTGFVGTPLMNNILSDNGFDKLAYELLLNEDYPGWLYEVKLGATTVWERWNSLLEDGTISGINMNSMNHYSYGSVLEWMFRHVAGINTIDTAPGVTAVEFIPTFNWDINNIEASYNSASGEYKISWKLIDPSHVNLSVTVPFGCSAKLKLPMANDNVYKDIENPMFKNVNNGVCYLESGEYSTSYKLTESLKKYYSINTPIKKLLENDKIAEKLTSMISLIAIPEQYTNYSILEIHKKFDGRISDEQLKNIDELLKNSINV